jgi:Lanthionine synthetase C-like protein
MRAMTAPRRPLLVGENARRALDVAEILLERGVRFVERRPDVPAGSPAGFCGAVLLADALVRTGRGSEAAVADLLRRALVFSRDRLSLHEGAAGLLVTLDAIDSERCSLAVPRARLREMLVASIHDAPPPDVDDVTTYDLVNGVAGRAVALRDDEPDALRALHTYAETFADAVERRIEQTGQDAEPLHLGVAHGVPGMLAALNAAFPHPYALARRYVELLLAVSHRAGGAHRWDSRWWPGKVPPARRAWCYHTAGVAAVLHDRALLDGDNALRMLAVAALDGVMHDERDDDAWFTPQLCHGRSGVATIAWHLAHEGERFQHTAAALADSVLNEFDEKRPLGYRGANHAAGFEEDRVAFLDGSLGIGLFLAGAAAAHERRWLPLLGLLPD